MTKANTKTETPLLPPITLTRAEIVGIVRQSALDALAAREAKARKALAEAAQPNDEHKPSKLYTPAVRQKTRRAFTNHPRIAGLIRALRAAGVKFAVYVSTSLNVDGTVSVRLTTNDVEVDMQPVFTEPQRTKLAKHKLQAAAMANARKKFDAEMRDIEAQRTKLRERDVLTAVVTRALAGQDSTLRTMLQKLGDEVARTLATTAIS